MKKPILYIDQHFIYSPSKGHEIAYYSISDSKTNKNWIIQYNTTLSDIIHYAMGYSEALNYDSHLYFSPRVDLSSYPEFLINVLTENEFQQRRLYENK